MQFNEEQGKILKQLLLDGRKNEQEIAEATGLTEEEVKTNYRKMEKNGIITGATTHINYKLFGYKAVSFISVNVHYEQADKLVKYLQGMPDIYTVYATGVGGNIDCILILKNFEQLNDVKDCIKNNFSVLEMKTAMWTGVKEMNYNLALSENIAKNAAPYNIIGNTGAKTNLTLDETDLKMADLLTEDGRIPIEVLGQKLSLPLSGAKKRYEKLRNGGALKVTIQIDPHKIGYRALCVLFATTSSEKSDFIMDRLSEVPDVISIMKTAGDYDLQIYAMVRDLEHLLAILERVGKIQGIIKMDTELYRFSDRMKKWPTPRQYMSTL